MADTVSPSEFRDEEHRDAHVRGLTNEYEGIKRAWETGEGDASERTGADRLRRLNEVNDEIKRIRGDGYPGHQNRLAGAAKTNRTAA